MKSDQPAAAASGRRGSIATSMTMASATKGEPCEKGALITTGTGLGLQPTDGMERCWVGGLPPSPVAVGIDTESLRPIAGAEKGAAGDRSPPGVPPRSKSPWSARRHRRRAGQGRRQRLRRARRRAGRRHRKVVATAAHDYRRLLPVRAGRLRPLRLPPHRGIGQGARQAVDRAIAKTSEISPSKTVVAWPGSGWRRVNQSSGTTLRCCAPAKPH